MLVDNHIDVLLALSNAFYYRYTYIHLKRANVRCNVCWSVKLLRNVQKQAAP